MEINKGAAISVSFVSQMGFMTTVGSSILQSHYFSGTKADEWLVENNYNTTIPYYVSSATTVLFGMYELSKSKNLPEKPKDMPPTMAFSMPSNISVPAESISVLAGSGRRRDSSMAFSAESISVPAEL